MGKMGKKCKKWAKKEKNIKKLIGKKKSKKKLAKKKSPPPPPPDEKVANEKTRKSSKLNFRVKNGKKRQKFLIVMVLRQKKSQ